MYACYEFGFFCCRLLTRRSLSCCAFFYSFLFLFSLFFFGCCFDSLCAYVYTGDSSNSNSSAVVDVHSIVVTKADMWQAMSEITPTAMREVKERWGDGKMRT